MMKRKIYPARGLLFISLLLLSCASSVMAATAEEKGLQIVREAEQRDRGWHDASSRMTMILINKHGEKRERSLTSKALEVEGDGDKRLAVFEYPPDVRGTALLTFTHKHADDDQWLYLPALKRVKRIATSNKSGSFMGSEFAYEDIAGDEVEKFSYRWLRDEQYQENDCFVVESIPVDAKYSGYSRRESWIDKSNYVVRKVHYFDRENKHFKTLFLSGYKEYLNKFWRPSMMEMVNHENERSTQIIWKGYSFNQGLDQKDFTSRALKH